MTAMTYRERREARAARLTEWADKRTAKAAAGFARGDAYRGDHAFNTQPGHIPERARVIAAEERAFQDMNKASSMQSRATGIEHQLDHAIYGDDPDAIERLTERVATLTAERDAMKERNAAFRKAHAAELKGLTAYGRDQAMPCQSFSVTNLSADIRRNAKRLADLQAQATEEPQPDRANRIVNARREGTCERCKNPIVAGELIGRFADGWSHVLPGVTIGRERCNAA